MPHCDEVGHLMKSIQHEDGRVSQHCMCTVHAEQNAICQAGGIGRVVCERKYHDGAESEEMFRQAGILIEFVHNEIQEYELQ